MFTYKTRIHLRDTDATGVLYFTEQLRLALETFEAYLHSQGISLRVILQTTPFLLPIVHAEADYFAPLQVGDPVEITWSVEKIGSSSFTSQFSFFDPARKLEVGKACIVHVVISRETKKSIPIPEMILRSLQAGSLK